MLTRIFKLVFIVFNITEVVKDEDGNLIGSQENGSHW